MSCRRAKMQIKPKVAARNSSLRSTSAKSESTQESAKSMTTDSQTSESTQPSISESTKTSTELTLQLSAESSSQSQEVEKLDTTEKLDNTVDESDKPLETKKRPLLVRKSLDLKKWKPNPHFSALHIPNENKDKLTSKDGSDVMIDNDRSPKITTSISIAYEDTNTMDNNEDNVDKSNDINKTETTSTDIQSDVTQTSETVKEITQSITIENIVITETALVTTSSVVPDKQKSVIESVSLSKPTKETNKRRKSSKLKSQTDKTKMKMKDLLLYNPPMTEDQKEQRKYDSESEKSGNEDTNSAEKVSNEITPKKMAKSTENDSMGPRVKVGADGTLILDEESVIVSRKKSQSNEPAVIETAKSTSAYTNYSSFRTRTRANHKPRWNEPETVRFFTALSLIGTDFTLMSNIFFKGKRSRLDLRNKFKKEEKVNRMMIDEAMSNPNSFINHCNELKDLISSDSSDDTDDETNGNKEDKVQTPVKQTKRKARAKK